MINHSCSTEKCKFVTYNIDIENRFVSFDLFVTAPGSTAVFGFPEGSVGAFYKNRKRSSTRHEFMETNSFLFNGRTGGIITRSTRSRTLQTVIYYYKELSYIICFFVVQRDLC